MTNKRKYVYDYPDNRLINAKLRVGDRVDIAEALNNKYTAEYVRLVLTGKRQNEEIIEMAKKIIADRENRSK